MIIHHCVLSTIFHEEVGILNIPKIEGLLYRKKNIGVCLTPMKIPKKAAESSF